MSKIKLELDAQDMRTLDKGLVALPYAEAAPLINKINAQIAKQIQPIEPPMQQVDQE